MSVCLGEEAGGDGGSLQLSPLAEALLLLGMSKAELTLWTAGFPRESTLVPHRSSAHFGPFLEARKTVTLSSPIGQNATMVKMRTLELRAMRAFAQGDTAEEWLSWDSSPRHPEPFRKVTSLLRRHSYLALKALEGTRCWDNF